MSRPDSGRALVGVLIPGAAIGLIAYGRPPERIPAPERIDLTGFSYWAICVAAYSAAPTTGGDSGLLTR